MKSTGLTGALVAVVAAISLAACGGADGEAKAAAEAATVSSAAAASSEAAASEAAAEASEDAVLKQRREAAASAAAQRSAEAAAASAAAEEARKVPTEFSGSGDDVVDITKPGDATAVIATITYQGGSNFVVKGVDGEEDLLVNTIGSYSGSTVLDGDEGGTTQLEVTASGPWTITLSDFTAAPALTAGANEGKGDTVLIYQGTRAKAAIAGRGDGNFVVSATSSSGRDLLVNEIGDYQGTVPLAAGPALIEISSEGTWTITVG